MAFTSFISPAIVSPEVVDVEIPKDDGGRMRRGLMVIAKVVQNLANNIFFGKEAHMIVLNEFLQGNIVNVTRFLSEVNVSPLLSLLVVLFLSWLFRNIPQQQQQTTTNQMNGWGQLLMIQTPSYCTVSSASITTRLVRSC
jgi:hypothetical protein